MCHRLDGSAGRRGGRRFDPALPHLLNGLLQVAFRAAFFVGPLMLAPLPALGSMQSAPVVDGLTFLGSAAAVGAIRVTRPAPTGGQTGLWSDLTAGLRAVRAAPDVLVVIVTFVLALALTNGFLAVGLVAVRGQGGQCVLLLGVTGFDGLAGVGAGAQARRRAPSAGRERPAGPVACDPDCPPARHLAGCPWRRRPVSCSEVCHARVASWVLVLTAATVRPHDGDGWRVLLAHALTAPDSMPEMKCRCRKT